MSSTQPVSKPKSSLFKKFESIIKKDHKINGVFDYILDNNMFPRDKDVRCMDKLNSGREYEIPYSRWLLITGIDREDILELNSMLKFEGYVNGLIMVKNYVVYIYE